MSLSSVLDKHGINNIGPYVVKKNSSFSLKNDKNYTVFIPLLKKLMKD